MEPKIKVVIIEDSAIITQMINDLLNENEKIEVIATCTNGIDGIQAIDTYTPDVVILDIIMPECDGFAVIEKEKEKKIHVRKCMIKVELPIRERSIK